MSLGDSKTSAGTWVSALASAITVGAGVPWANYNGGYSGTTVATNLAMMDGMLAAAPVDAEYSMAVLINLGVNDCFFGLPAEATWKANYRSILDKVHAKAPKSPVYLMRPWGRTYDACAATLHGWIDDLVATAGADGLPVHVGPDEAVWLKGVDDGATMTSDGTHYSAAGNAEAVVQWRAVAGF